MPEQTQGSNLPAFDLFKESLFLGLGGVLGPLRPDRLSPAQKIVFGILGLWAPMAILAAVQGSAFVPSQPQSFLKDPAMYARFLLVFPLIFVSQKKISAMLRLVSDHFLKAQIVKAEEREKYIGNIDAVMRLRYSPVVDWLILAVVTASSAIAIRMIVPGLPATWRTLGPESRRQLTWAGWWLYVVSDPILAFVLLRFVYRIGLWWRLLWQTSHLDLQLDAAHPDSVGGIGFLGLTLRSFKEAGFAVSALLAGGLADIVLATGARVTTFKFEIAMMVIAVTALFAGPLMFFHDLLRRTKYRGYIEYGELWQRQRRQFAEKWMRSSPERPELLNIHDFSEATDLSEILERVQQIQLMPFRQAQILPLIISVVAPFALVALLEFPVAEVMKVLLKMVF